MSTHTDLPQNPTTYYISIPQEVGRYPPVQPDPRPTIGNGVSGDQGNLPSHGKRDVGVTFDRKQHDWSKLAEEQEVNTLMSNVDPYIGAQLRDSKQEDNSHVAGVDPYIVARNVGPNSSIEDDDARLGAYIGAQPWGSKSTKDDVAHDTYIDAVDATQGRTLQERKMTQSTCNRGA